MSGVSEDVALEQMLLCTTLTAVKCLVVLNILFVLRIRGRKTYALNSRLLHLNLAPGKVIVALLLHLSQFDLQHLVVLPMLACVWIEKSLLRYELVLHSVVVRIEPIARVASNRGVHSVNASARLVRREFLVVQSKAIRSLVKYVRRLSCSD
jgi:hypothetical protein